ncbi:unnamed protein product [Gongylonema pulchrum]|uniref:BAG domain-containing protein n=1 Tax=Gongylonema pulchrum TaxID=637853 RepID=A0A183EFP2_9BILA|nr:unnamed protein product [Gongylonema pulchrum]
MHPETWKRLTVPVYFDVAKPQRLVFRSRDLPRRWIWSASRNPEFGKLHTSLADLKESLEKEADRLKSNPEEALMNYMRQNSALLSSQINTLRESSGQLLNEPSKRKLDAITTYLEDLDKNLGEAQDVHEVKDEILKEARDRLTDLVQWTTSRISEQQKQEERKDEHEQTGDSSSKDISVDEDKFHSD